MKTFADLRTVALCLSAIGTFLAAGLAAAAETPAPGLYPPGQAEEKAFAVLGSRPIPDGRAYAPFYGYVIGPQAVVEKGTVYVVFQNARGRPVAMAYQPDKKAWLGPVKVADFGIENDDHGNPSLCIDSKGFLHVFYGCHGGPMRHARSERPYDIGAWQDAPSPVAKATYPQTMRMADGRIRLFYRAGGHPEPWTMLASADDCLTWSAPQPVIEMRKAPRDPAACAYAFFFPGSDGRTVHCFWNHKDDNAARVTDKRPHPWRPLKYPGLHEAVYRYNVYYVRLDADGTWRSAAGEAAALPISKAEADSRCLAFDSGDEFTFIGMSLAVDAANRPYLRFGTGVVDWVRQHKDPKAVVVPVTDRFACFASGRWQVSPAAPADWPADVRRILATTGMQAYGDEWPAGHWFISAKRQPSRPDVGCSVFLFGDQAGYISRDGGPAQVE